MSATELEAQMLSEARAEVSNADHKASLILAALGVGFGALAGGLLAGDWEPGDLSEFGEWLWWIGAVLALGSVACAAFSVWPRFSAKDISSGIYYWAHVAHYRKLDDFTAALAQLPPQRPDRTRHQLWHLSRIVKKKHWGVRLAIIFASGAVFLFLAASIVGG